jgi:hypothetical protein
MNRKWLSLFAVLTLLVGAAWTYSPKAPAWEYKIIETRFNDNALKELNDEGRQGWELVNSLPSQSNAGFTVFYLKRGR